MSKSEIISRITCVSTVFSVSIALMTSVDTAAAKGSHHGDQPKANVGGAKVAISRQNDGEKNISTDRHGKKEKHANKENECGKPGAPTAGCAVSTKAPVGGMRVGAGIAESKTPAPPKQASAAASVVSLSNGVTKSVIEVGKGLTVTSSAPGTITVFNGTNSVTMAGGTLTLHGAQSVSAGSGMQVVRLTNGDVSVAVSPILMGQTRPVPPGVTLGDDLKAIGKAAANGAAVNAVTPVVFAGAAAVELGSVVVGTVAGHPIQCAKDTAKDLAKDIKGALDWASSLF